MNTRVLTIHGYWKFDIKIIQTMWDKLEGDHRCVPSAARFAMCTSTASIWYLQYLWLRVIFINTRISQPPFSEGCSVFLLGTIKRIVMFEMYYFGPMGRPLRRTTLVPKHHFMYCTCAQRGNNKYKVSPIISDFKSLRDASLTDDIFHDTGPCRNLDRQFAQSTNRTTDGTLCHASTSYIHVPDTMI